ncbi:hypothetical protein SLA2020_318310 [Shorea laevis]
MLSVISRRLILHDYTSFWAVNRTCRLAAPSVQWTSTAWNEFEFFDLLPPWLMFCQNGVCNFIDPLHGKRYPMSILMFLQRFSEFFTPKMLDEGAFDIDIISLEDGEWVTFFAFTIYELVATDNNTPAFFQGNFYFPATTPRMENRIYFSRFSGKNIIYFSLASKKFQSHGTKDVFRGFYHTSEQLLSGWVELKW